MWNLSPARLEEDFSLAITVYSANISFYKNIVALKRASVILEPKTLKSLMAGIADGHDGGSGVG